MGSKFDGFGDFAKIVNAVIENDFRSFGGLLRILRENGAVGYR